MKMSSFVFVCMLLIKGDRTLPTLQCSNSDAKRNAFTDAGIIAVCNIITLSVGETCGK